MHPRETSHHQHYFIFDQDLLNRVDVTSFDPGHYEQQGALNGQARGRGTTHFVTIHLNTGEQACVLRHYHRGGFIARFNKDRYQWTGLQNTRAWREWQLLRELFEQGLPVPQPLAAHVSRSGLFYSADIITLRITAADTLSRGLTHQALSVTVWQNIGSTIKRFHDARIYHADLNAHNILLSEAGDCWLIDFDKGERRQGSTQWQQANLDRLRRSLDKLKSQTSTFYFDEQCWQDLLRGYSGIKE